MTKSNNFVFSAVKDYFCSLPSSIASINKVQIILYVTWMWAWVGLYTAKTFEYIFKMILTVPDDWLFPLNSIVKDIKTTDKKPIQILNAFKENGEEITNKLKLFLHYYWTEAMADSAHDQNGFDFRKFSALVQTPLMFCSYIVKDTLDKVNNNTLNTKSNNTFDILLNDVHRIFVTRQGKKSFISHMPNLSEQEGLFLNHFTFDTEVPHVENEESLFDVQSIIEKIEKNNNN